MTERKKIIECIYCGKRAQKTKDHVLSQALFSEPIKNAITVPSCDKCNKSFSEDEEYFRIHLTVGTAESSVDAHKLFFSKVKRSIQRNPKIGHKILRQMNLVDLYTSAGIYVGRKTRMEITREDQRRFYNVLDKYIKGLVFHELNDILPSEYSIRHVMLNKESLEANKDKIKSLKWNNDNWEVFAYGYSHIPRSCKSVWVMVFYNSIIFESFVATEENFSRARIAYEGGEVHSGENS